MRIEGSTIYSSPQSSESISLALGGNPHRSWYIRRKLTARTHLTCFCLSVQITVISLLYILLINLHSNMNIQMHVVNSSRSCGSNSGQSHTSALSRMSDRPSITTQTWMHHDRRERRANLLGPTYCSQDAGLAESQGGLLQPTHNIRNTTVLSLLWWLYVVG